ncbi:MAG: hypothetical protein SAJ12_14725 [Jaaginema sp. PMC 1079.18]|nr:hypothetical protein [Jaaginema sp. PMC 1080.18]MEC4852239.1 hypothetical protein [Jaaginema sp. PMC 1079.18]MEC4866228.1 hypothetical protein [Jaaginema sp. PMC 1078.18]
MRFVIALWLIFLLTFVLLGYSVWYSILVGAIAGFTSGWIGSWWKQKDKLEPPPVTSPKTPLHRVPSLRPRKRKGIIEAQHHLKDVRYKRKQSKAWKESLSNIFSKR